MTQREHDLENLLHDLEGDLKKRMELNWKLLFTIDEVSKERNFFYNLLLQIEVYYILKLKFIFEKRDYFMSMKTRK